MIIIHPVNGLLIISLLHASFLHAQQDSSSCKVNLQNLTGSYTGDCKKGLADGKGEAKGFHRYAGSFKNGMPNGNGVYYYSETEYHTGNFQDGKKEGKGETHYLLKEKPDSVIKGYWSGDEFRGKEYVTYRFKSTARFDFQEIRPSDNSGNSVTFEIGTNSGSPNGAPTKFYGLSGFVLTLKDLVSPTGSIVKISSKYESALKASITYELNGFPCQLFGTLSNGEVFELELYKSANWKVRFFVNK